MPSRPTNKRPVDPVDDGNIKKQKVEAEVAAGSTGDNNDTVMATDDGSDGAKKPTTAGNVDADVNKTNPSNVINNSVNTANNVDDNAKKDQPTGNLDDGAKKADTTSDVDDGAKKENKQTTLNVVKTYSPALKKRLEALMSHADADNLVYNIQRLPDGSRWFMMDDTPRKRAFFLVDVKKRQPVTILLVGKVVYTFLGKPKSTPPNSVSITVEPLDAGDQTKSDSVLKYYSKRKKSEAGTSQADVDDDDDLTLHDGIRASAWMLYEDEGESTATAKPFMEIYDARSKFIMPVSELPKLDRSNIELGDLVVIEARITRYSPKQANATPDSPSKDWKLWTAAFRMQSCALLKKHDPVDVEDKPVASSSAKTWEI